MSFLPQDYTIPTDSKYMKFVAGENTFRILSDAITGWEWWTSETVDGKEVRKPNRVSEEDGIPAEEYNEDQPPKHFWAFVVWNYTDKKVQILEITQKGIQQAISALNRSKGWGDPKGYDISVTKVGEKLETKYSVMPIPPLKVEVEIMEKYKTMNINIEKLFTGEDPFTSEKVDADEMVKNLK